MSRIYALLSVKFSGLKMCQCKKMTNIRYEYKQCKRGATSVMVYSPKEYWWQSLLRSDSDSPNDLSAQLQRLTKATLEPKGGIMGTLATF